MKESFHENIYQDPMAAIIRVLWKITMMQKETALSMHANSLGVATAGFQLLCVICPLAAC